MAQSGNTTREVHSPDSCRSKTNSSGTPWRTRMTSGLYPPATRTRTRCTPPDTSATCARRGPKKNKPKPATARAAATTTTRSMTVMTDSSIGSLTITVAPPYPGGVGTFDPRRCDLGPYPLPVGGRSVEGVPRGKGDAMNRQHLPLYASGARAGRTAHPGRGDPRRTVAQGEIDEEEYRRRLGILRGASTRATRSTCCCSSWYRPCSSVPSPPPWPTPPNCSAAPADPPCRPPPPAGRRRSFQFTCHLVMPSRTYALSVCRRTVTGLVRLSNAAIAAISSIRLFVVGCGCPP